MYVKKFREVLGWFFLNLILKFLLMLLSFVPADFSPFRASQTCVFRVCCVQAESRETARSLNVISVATSLNIRPEVCKSQIYPLGRREG